jgi:hypothetical protein
MYLSIYQGAYITVMCALQQHAPLCDTISSADMLLALHTTPRYAVQSSVHAAALPAMHICVHAVQCSIAASLFLSQCSEDKAVAKMLLSAIDDDAGHMLTAYLLLLLLLLQTRRQVKAGDSIHLISATDKGGALALNIPPAASSSKHTSNGAYNYDDAESIDSSAAAAAGPAVKVLPTTIKGGIDEQLYTWQITVSGSETVASVTATTVTAVVLRQSRSCLTQHRRKQLVE